MVLKGEPRLRDSQATPTKRRKSYIKKTTSTDWIENTQNQKTMEPLGEAYVQICANGLKDVAIFLLGA